MTAAYRSQLGRRSAGLVLLAALGVLLLSGFGAAPDVVVLGPKGPHAPVPPALFSHQGHPLPCHQCHPGLYSPPPVRLTHAQMSAGQSCGACHQGERAVAIGKLPCQQCHVK